MKLSLSPRLKAETSLKTEQKLDHSLSIDLKQQIANLLSLELGGFQSDLVGNPTDILTELIRTVIAKAPNEKMRTALAEIFSDKLLTEAVLAQYENLVFPNPEIISGVVVDYLFRVHEGRFSYEGRQEDSLELSTGNVELDRDAWIRATKDPGALEKERDIIIQVMNRPNNPNQDIEGAKMRIDQINDALAIASLSREHIEALTHGLTYLFEQRDEKGEKTVPTFIKEYSILNKMNQDVADRILKRFAANFLGSRQRTPEQMQNAFLNTISEFSLVSMGIISREIFVTEGADLDPKIYNFMKKQAEEVGVNLDLLMDRYGLKKTGRIIWNRWATLKTAPSIEMDNTIREFTTVTLRRSSREILNAANYEDFFGELKEGLKKEVGQKASKSSFVMGMLTDKLSDPEFKNFLLSKIRDQWMQQVLGQAITK